MRWTSALVEGFLRVAFRTYFRAIHVRGLESVPATGPVLLVANHPNTLLDPAILLHVLPRPIHFGAKHTLFKTPLRPILDALGAIPIVRVQDDPRAMRQNLQAIGAYIDLLNQGGATAIFPEGLSQDDPHLAPMKGGAARIALQAEDKRDFKLNLRIVPVGLQFEPRRKFRGDAYVRFGEPFGVADLEGLYRDKRAAAFRAVTARIASALGELSFHVESTDHIRFVRRLTEVYLQRVGRTGLAGVGSGGLRGELLYRMAACLNHFSDRDPELVASVEQSLQRYERLREAAGVDSRLVDEPSYLVDGPLAPVQATLELALGLIPAAFGYLTGALPFYLTRYLASVYASRTHHLPSLSLWHVLIGGVLFPLIWGLEVFAVWSAGSFNLTVLFGVLLVPSGLFGRIYIRRSRKLALHLSGRIAAWMKMGSVLRVRDARSELITLMDTVRSRYLEEVFAPATRQTGPSDRSRKV